MYSLLHWSLHLQLLCLSQLTVTRAVSSSDTKFLFWHKMSLLVSDLCLKPGESSSQDRGTQSHSAVKCILQASTCISIVVQVVTIDWFISKRTRGWWMKWLTNDVKGRHKPTIYVPVILFTRNKSLKIKSTLRELSNKEQMPIWYPKTCTSRSFDTPQPVHFCDMQKIPCGISMFSSPAVFFSL